jgi:hypothetical protein
MEAQESKPSVPEFPTAVHLYYAISRSLRRGSNGDGWPKRPALPIEIILKIFDWAGFSTRPAIDRLIATCKVLWGVSSSGSPVIKTFKHTKPMTEDYLTRLRRLQVETGYYYPGYVSDLNNRSWAWFEDVVILSPNAVQDGEEKFGMLNHPPFDTFVFDLVITNSAPKLHPNDPSKVLVWHSRHT